MNVSPRPNAWLRVMPFAYVAAGLGVIAWQRSAFGLVVGLMLVSAAIALWVIGAALRRTDTHGAQPASTRRPATPAPAAAADAEGADVASLVRLVWDSRYECGQPVIDRQHQRLVEQGNALLNAALRREPLATVEHQLEDLVRHIRAHFRVEAEVLSRTSHPITPEHEADHQALLEKAEAIRRRFARGQVDVSELMAFVTDDLFTQHITREDLQLTKEDLEREREAAAADAG